MNIITKNFDIHKFYDTLILVDISVLVCLWGIVYISHEYILLPFQILKLIKYKVP